MFHLFFQCFKIRSTLRNEFAGKQLFFYNFMQHSIEQQHIGIGLELQALPGMACDIGAAWVGKDNLGALSCRVLHPSGGHRMIRCRV